MSIQYSHSNADEFTNKQLIIKTLQIKNAQIQELLRQLSQTQKLHQSVKKKYLHDEALLKNKVIELQQIINKMKMQNQALHAKYTQAYQKTVAFEEQQEKTSKQWDAALNNVYEQIEAHKKQREEYESKISELQETIGEQNEKIAKLDDEKNSLREEVQKVRVLNKEKEEVIQVLKKEIQDLNKKERECKEESEKEKRKTKNLNDLEEKIKKIMIDL